MLIRCAWPAGL